MNESGRTVPDWQASGCQIASTCAIAIVLSAGLSSPARAEDLVASYLAQCNEQKPALLARIENKSSERIRIRSGSWPWNVDLIGTHFVVSAGGKKLQQGPTANIGRIGPLGMDAGEIKEKIVPISSYFPDIPAYLDKGPIQNAWTYPIDVVAGEDVNLSGVVIMKSNPCHATAR